MSETTFDNLPKAVDYLIKEMETIKEHILKSNVPPPEKKRPVGMSEACQILGKARSTIYTLVRKGLIPCCKAGKQLYFYENELLDWIAAGRKKSVAETKADIEMQMQRSVRNKPRNSSFLD